MHKSINCCLIFLEDDSSQSNLNSFKKISSDCGDSLLPLDLISLFKKTYVHTHTRVHVFYVTITRCKLDNAFPLSPNNCFLQSTTLSSTQIFCDHIMIISTTFAAHLQAICLRIGGAIFVLCTTAFTHYCAQLQTLPPKGKIMELYFNKRSPNYI